MVSLTCSLRRWMPTDSDSHGRCDWCEGSEGGSLGGGWGPGDGRCWGPLGRAPYRAEIAAVVGLPPGLKELFLGGLQDVAPTQ